MSLSTSFFDTARCRARIAGMRDEELEEYILRVKSRLMRSHEGSYFLEESLLLQLGEACEEHKRRQTRLSSVDQQSHRYEHRREHRQEFQQGAD